MGTGVLNSATGGDTINSAVDAGAVYVFTRSGGTWAQQAYVKASNTGASDFFGLVALSGDGNTLAVGAIYEDGAGIGVLNNATGGDTDDGASRAGAVYVFTRSGETWVQQAYVKASNTGASDFFGRVALSGDGNTLAVGAYREDGAGTGVLNSATGGDTADGAPDAGAVYVY